MMYDEMLTLICLSIEICVLSTEEACCPFLVSFLDSNDDQKCLGINLKVILYIYMISNILRTYYEQGSECRPSHLR